MVKDHVWSTVQSRHDHMVRESQNMAQSPQYREGCFQEARQLRSQLGS